VIEDLEERIIRFPALFMGQEGDAVTAEADD
jgi:hypothetical protein